MDSSLELLGVRAILDDLPRNLLKNESLKFSFNEKPRLTSPRLLTRIHWAPFPSEYCSIALNTCDPGSDAASRSKLRPNIENWERSFLSFLFYELALTPLFGRRIVPSGKTNCPR